VRTFGKGLRKARDNGLQIETVAEYLK
jgi:hypothetical protein